MRRKAPVVAWWADCTAAGHNPNVAVDPRVDRRPAEGCKTVETELDRYNDDLDFEKHIFL